MSRALARALSALGVVAGVLLFPAAAFAHPLGNFTVNTSARIVLSPGIARIEYALDMAEIPTVQLMPQLDADADGAVAAAELSSFARSTAPGLLANLVLVVDGERVALEVTSARADLRPGQGGLDILRLDASFAGEIGRAGEIEFDDANFEGRVGWHEVTAVGADGVAVEGSTVPTTSVSDGLRRYPEDLLSSPLDVREANLSFAPGPSAPVADLAEPVTPAERPGVVGGAFADLVERTGPLMPLALVLALAFGAAHALGPGHGKTLMAAYLVGAGGRARQAVSIGAAVAVMHTAAVLALGLVVLYATRVFAPERVYPWLGLGSGLIALGLGAALLVVRLGAWSDRDAHVHDGHGTPVHHEHAHAGGVGHDHGHPAPSTGVLSRKGLVALAAAGGILPSPTALVVLLASVALHRVAYGLALIGAFSLGLASALVAVGILALRARDVVARRVSSRFARLLPVVSAATIALMGLVLTLNGVARL